MSPRFWLFSMASAGAALAGGLGLGLYATTPPRVAFTDAATSYSDYQENVVEEPEPAALNGPVEITCKGCGPTLADRQMAAMTGGGWSGYDDPVVRDYMAQDYETSEVAPVVAEEARPMPVRQLPPNIERFAAGEVHVPVQMVQHSLAEHAAPLNGGRY